MREKNSKGRKSETTRKVKPKQDLKEPIPTVGKAAAAPDDPIGACQFTDNSGQISCIDNITKSECAKLKNSIFLVGETCD